MMKLIQKVDRAESIEWYEVSFLSQEQIYFVAFQKSLSLPPVPGRAKSHGSQALSDPILAPTSAFNTL